MLSDLPADRTGLPHDPTAAGPGAASGAPGAPGAHPTMPASPHDLGAVVDRLSAGVRGDRLRHRATVPARQAGQSRWPSWADPEVVAAYAARGVTQPWRHQMIAADAAHAGRHVVISTGTASGKSLAYALPALTRIREGRGPRGQRGSATLYLAPTKALAQDQFAAIDGLGVDVRVATHDGDAPPEQREWTRDHAEYVLSNPDMLHRSLLPGHARWSRFFAALDFVVVDEAHHYRGVFGAHVAQILRRLRRVCALYGSTPTFVLASATMADPEVAAARLTGLEVTAVTEDTSPRGPLEVLLWEPPLIDGLGEHGAPVRRPAGAETSELLADLVVEGVRTLAFVRSRRGVESVARRAGELLAEVDPGLGDRVDSYRGGYLPEERRALETDLRSGRLLGMAATNALELGIDISGLDAVVVAGYPGTRAAFWQQVGRAGRTGAGAVGVLVARDDPLDTYLVHHPEALLGLPVEGTVFDTDNPYVLGPHLCAAAQEAPLRSDELDLFGPRTREILGGLVAAGLLRRRAAGWYWTDRSRAADLADIRSSGGGQIQLIEGETGRVVGTVDGGRAPSTAHPGAIYLHRGETWLVRSLDLDDHVAVMDPVQATYTTTARELSDITIVAEQEATSWGRCRLAMGTVEVSQQVVSFLRRRFPSGEVVDETPLDLPERTLSTTAVWWTVPAEVLAESGLDAEDLPGAAHAAEHCSIGLLPLFATCDRWDIGGVSTALHPDTGELTVFVHDGHPGGAGFAARGYRTAHAWLSATRATIEDCACPDGCPSCIQSPKCGNGNNPLDKRGALRLLEMLLADAVADRG